VGKSIRGDNRGLTLVELLIGITILAIIVVPLLAVFASGANTAWKSHTYSDATQAAQNLAEQIQAVDIDDLLANAGKICGGAEFCTKSTDSSGNMIYTPCGTAAPSSADNIYYVCAGSAPLGTSDYDALITLDANSPVNGTDVSVSNRMDALIGMTGADSSALTDLKTQYGGYFSDPGSLTLSGISRNVSITVTRDSNYYDISAVFSYSGPVTYTRLSKTVTEEFDYSDTGTSRISAADAVPNGKPIFSVYLLFNAYYSDKDTITINNLADGDFNVFLADVTDSPTVSAGYTAMIMYRSQYDNTVPRVFTNIAPAYTVYRAFDRSNPAFYKTLPVSGKLVETKDLKRKFSVTVSLFKSGGGFTGKPITSFDSSKLD